jgi:hypothetical protein
VILFSEPTKISRRYLEDGTPVRVSKATGQLIPKPHPLADRKPRSTSKHIKFRYIIYYNIIVCVFHFIVVGPKDTSPQDVFEVTFNDYELYMPHILSQNIKKA